MKHPQTNPAANSRLAWSIEEIAEKLGISRSSVYYEMESGRLKSSKIGKRRVITNVQLEAYLTLLHAKA